MPVFLFPTDTPENSEAFARASTFLASTVCLLTGGSATAPVVTTVSSVTAVSAEPPLLLVCITAGSTTLDRVDEGGEVTVHVLRPEHRELAKTFGSGTRASDAPLESMPLEELDRALARFDCVVDRFIGAGDHVIVMLRVLRVRTDVGEPLIYWRRGLYRLDGSHDFLESAEAFESFVNDWKDGVLPRDRWTHAAHVAVAAYHAFNAGGHDCYDEMREGILRFNRCCGIENTDTSGFHETLTRFWWDTVSAFVNDGGFDTAWDAARSTVAEYGSDRDLFRMSYNHDVVADRVARRSWVPPTRHITAVR